MSSANFTVLIKCHACLNDILFYYFGLLLQCTAIDEKANAEYNIF